MCRSRPVWSLSPEVAASYNKLRAWVAMSDGMYEKYNKAPPPVNFSEQKKAVRDKALVDTLEAFYKSNTPPAEIHEWSQEDKEKTDAQIAYLKELDSLHKELIPVLQEEIDFQKNNRTSKETTMFDMKVNYPLIHEEIEDELEKRQWFKDTGFDSSK